MQIPNEYVSTAEDIADQVWANCAILSECSLHVNKTINWYCTLDEVCHVTEFISFVGAYLI